MLNNAFGFQGSPMHGITSQPLAAPQATLISALAQGVITGDLPWNLIGIGALIGLVIVAIDELLRRTGGRQFPPLAVALGIYLPMSVTFMVVVGAFIGKVLQQLGVGQAERRRRDTARRPARIGLHRRRKPRRRDPVGHHQRIANRTHRSPCRSSRRFHGAGELIGGIAFVLVVFGMYRWVAGLARRAV